MLFERPKSASDSIAGTIMTAWLEEMGRWEVLWGRWNFRWTKQEAIYIASDVTRFFGVCWAGIAKRNNKRRIASDVPRSFSRFLKGQLTLHTKRIIAVFQHDHKYENSTHRVISVQLTGMSCIRCASPSRWEASLAHLHRI